MYHKDDQGHAGLVNAGGLHRITAGRGMWHGEGLGEGSDGSGPVRLHVLQLWINLPRALKQLPADHQPVQAEAIPEKTVGDARVRVLVGDGAPTRLQTPALYLDATLPANGATDLAVPAGFQGFAYVLDGGGTFGANAREAHARQFVVLGQASAAAGGQTSFLVRAGAGGLRFALAAARPTGETPRWGGPFVD
jgi:redox-sensitive bicupin YhaK (pirin superfamily)